MALVDIAPIATGAVTLATSAFGLLLERRKRRVQDDEPAAIEIIAVEAMTSVSETPPRAVTMIHGHDDPVLVSVEEMKEVVATAVAAELKKANKNSQRSSIIIGLIFFVAGIFASVTVTLLIHPLGTH